LNSPGVDKEKQRHHVGNN